jgi:hypothetical protein
MMHSSGRDWTGHVRGPDGYLTSYGDEETREMVARNARHVAACQPAMFVQIPGNLKLSCYLFPDEPFSMGPRLYWTVAVPSGTVIAAGVVERDLDWEEEKQELDGNTRLCWISQGAFVLPEYQRQGIYSTVLREIRRLTGCSLLPDTQHTRASSSLWKKLAVEFGFDPDEVPHCPGDG